QAGGEDERAAGQGLILDLRDGVAATPLNSARKRLEASRSA
ncbi:MAG: hypothetical protein QOK23_3679, partial [Gammaproteobacteria bacterium]|nr:hypothetical protein [Gammaproteobacteria bacterium]